MKLRPAVLIAVVLAGCSGGSAPADGALVGLGNASASAIHYHVMILADDEVVLASAGSLAPGEQQPLGKLAYGAYSVILNVSVDGQDMEKRAQVTLNPGWDLSLRYDAGDGLIIKAREVEPF